MYFTLCDGLNKQWNGFLEFMDTRANILDADSWEVRQSNQINGGDGAEMFIVLVYSETDRAICLLSIKHDID